MSGTQAICRAFGNAERVRLIACLRTPKNVSKLLSQCTLSQSALSQHLRVLRDAGVVRASRVGRNIVYRVPDKKMRAIAQVFLTEQRRRVRQRLSNEE